MWHYFYDVENHHDLGTVKSGAEAKAKFNSDPINYGGFKKEFDEYCIKNKLTNTKKEGSQCFIGVDASGLVRASLVNMKVLENYDNYSL